MTKHDERLARMTKHDAGLPASANAFSTLMDERSKVTRYVVIATLFVATAVVLVILTANGVKNSQDRKLTNLEQRVQQGDRDREALSKQVRELGGVPVVTVPPTTTTTTVRRGVASGTRTTPTTRRSPSTTRPPSTSPPPTSPPPTSPPPSSPPTTRPCRIGIGSICVP